MEQPPPGVTGSKVPATEQGLMGAQRWGQTSVGTGLAGL